MQDVSLLCKVNFTTEISVGGHAVSRQPMIYLVFPVLNHNFDMTGLLSFNYESGGKEEKCTI